MNPQTLVIALTAALLASLVGCAQINDASLSFVSSTRPAAAVVDDQLLQGDIRLFPDHTGTVTLRANGEPSLGAAALTSCMGRLRNTATTTGAIDLRCNGGVMANVSMTLLGDTRGYGYGTTASGTASLVFGLSAADTRAYLRVPPNRQLVEHAEAPYLELK